jgi:hypothetical protein
MPKHEPEIHTLEEIIDAMGAYRGADYQWHDLIRVDMPGHADALAADDFFTAFRVEDRYINAHASDRYRVTWPDHVTVKKFNSDATYQPV